MNPGLLYLLRKGPAAWLRSMRGKMHGVKGVIVAVVGGFLLTLLLGGQVARIALDARAGPTADPESVRLFGPPLLLFLVLLLDLSGRGLYFRPAEIDLLFPAPVTRRSMILYHLASRAGVQVFSGLWSALFTVRWAGTVAGGVAASVMVLLLLQLTAQLVALAVAAAGERFGPRVRWTAWAAVVAVGVVAARQTLADLPRGAPAGETLRAVAGSPWIVAATLPVRPFAELFAAPAWIDVVLWFGVCASILGFLVLLVLRLDVAYEESALATSRRVQERIRRMRSGEGAFLPKEGAARRRRVPRLPRWGGVGPLAHRQVLELVRNPAGALWSAGSVLVLVTFAVLAPRFEGSSGGDSHEVSWVLAGFVAVLLPLVVVQGFGFDFRRDLDRMDVLRSLPLRPAAVAAGQLAVPAAVFTLTQAAALAIVAAASPVPPWAVLAALLVLLPWNWFTASVDNALFLVLPYRIDPEDPAKVPFMGRLMLTSLAKMGVFAAVGCAVSVPAAFGAAQGGAAGAALVALAWLVLVGAAVGGTYAVAAAFRRFDVGRDST